MTEASLERAVQIKKQIDQLKYEIKRLPKERVSTNKESEFYDIIRERIVTKGFLLKIPNTFALDRHIMILTDEDLKALIEVREKKLKALRKELEELS